MVSKDDVFVGDLRVATPSPMTLGELLDSAAKAGGSGGDRDHTPPPPSPSCHGDRSHDEVRRAPPYYYLAQEPIWQGSLRNPGRPSDWSRRARQWLTTIP